MPNKSAQCARGRHKTALPFCTQMEILRVLEVDKLATTCTVCRNECGKWPIRVLLILGFICQLVATAAFCFFFSLNQATSQAEKKHNTPRK